MIRLGLIGCGAHSEGGHAVPLARYKSQHPDEILLAAVCDLQIERALDFGRKYGFLAAYRNVEDMLKQENLDGCVAVVPVDGISELGIKLLSAGIPCVVEKPLGASLPEVRALQDAAVATHTPNMVSVNRRFMPFLNRALEWTRNAGALRYVHCTLARHARQESKFLRETAIHALDTLRYIAGEVLESEIRILQPGVGMTEWYAIDLKFQNRVSGRIDVLPTTGMVEETYELFGEGYRTSVTCPFGPQRGWRCFRDGHLISEELAAPDTPEDILNGCYDETTEFIRALKNKSAPRPSIVEVVPSVELCLEMAEFISRIAVR